MGIEDDINCLFQKTDTADTVDLRYWSSYKGYYEVAFQDDQKDVMYVFAVQEGLTNNPIVGMITFADITRQCEEQGIVSTASVIQIWGRVKNCLLQDTLDGFNISESQFKISVKISGLMKVFFIIHFIEIKDCKLVSTIMGSLIKYVTTIAQFCMEETRKVISIMKEKDKNIEYLKVLVKDLGGEQILQKHAPIGSFNHEVLKPFDQTHLRDLILADKQDKIQVVNNGNIFDVGKSYINDIKSSIDEQYLNSVLPKGPEILVPGNSKTLQLKQTCTGKRPL